MSTPPSGAQSLKIPSATPGWQLDAWRFTPPGNGSTKPVPVIVMAHGFGANKLMSLGDYAEAFSELGYACIVFDYRRWGASDGTPRHILDVKDQLEDYRTVIKYARQQPECDAQRVVAWGTSFSGGHAITLASEPSLNLSLAIAQCPYTGSSSKPPISVGFARTVLYAVLSTARQALGLSPIYIKAAADPGAVGCLTAPGSREGLASVCKDPRDCPNEVSASALLQVVAYDPLKHAKGITCPVLIVAPIQDGLCLLSGARKVAKETSKCELLEVSGGHFEVYPGLPRHAESLKAQKSFLQKHVPL